MTFPSDDPRRRRFSIFDATNDGGIAPPSDDSPMNLDDFANRNRVEQFPDATPERRDLNEPPTHYDSDPTAAPHYGALTPPQFDDKLSASPDDGAPPRDDAGAPVESAPPASPSNGIQPRHNAALEKNLAEYGDLASHPAVAKHGRIVAALENAFMQASRQAQEVTNNSLRTGRPVDSYGLASVAGAGAGGGFAAAVNPVLPEEEKRKYRMESLARDIGAQVQLEREQAALGVQQANAAWLQAKPGIEQQKALSTATQRERQAVLANLRLLKGTRLDVNNPQHFALLQRAANAGIHVDPDEWNNSKGNVKTFDLVDPDHPEQKRKVAYNVVTGEATDAGQSGYVQPVKPSGMTEAQERADADRDASRTNTEKQRATSNDFQRQRIGISRSQLQLGLARLNQGEARLSQSADHQTQTRFNQLSTLIQRRNALQAQSNRWRSYKDDEGNVQPWAEKRAAVFEDQIRSVEDRMQSEYGDLLDEAADSGDGMINGPQKAMENKGLMRTPHAPARSAPAQSSPSQPASVPRVSRARFRAKYPQFNGRPDADVDAAISSSGGQPIP
jgi:hypothetical protein